MVTCQNLHKHNCRYHFVRHIHLRKTIKVFQCFLPSVNILSHDFHRLIDRSIGAPGCIRIRLMD